jgi:hypothetical protein
MLLFITGVMSLLSNAGQSPSIIMVALEKRPPYVRIWSSGHLPTAFPSRESFESNTTRFLFDGLCETNRNLCLILTLYVRTLLITY